MKVTLQSAVCQLLLEIAALFSSLCYSVASVCLSSSTYVLWPNGAS